MAAAPPAPAPAPRPVIPPIPAPRPVGAPAAAPPAVPAPEPEAELRLRAWAALESPGGQKVFYVDRDSVLIGRASPADGIAPEVDLGDLPEAGTISRRHARLVRGGDEVLLEDLGSANGTFLNGERLPQGLQKPVFENDELRFGAVRFVFHGRKKGRT